MLLFKLSSSTRSKATWQLRASQSLNEPMNLGELIKYLRLYILALGNQMGFSPRSSKLLYFTMLYLLEDATPENLPHQLLLYGVVTSRLDRTYMADLIVDGRTHQFLTTDGEVRLCYVPSLATVLSIPIICCFHHASIPIYKNSRWKCST